MNTYKVNIREILKLVVEVEAANRYEAEKAVEKRWKDCEYILDANHFEGVTFKASPLLN